MAFSEKEVVRGSLAAKEVFEEIAVEKAIQDQVSFREKVQKENFL